MLANLKGGQVQTVQLVTIVRRARERASDHISYRVDRLFYNVFRIRHMIIPVKLHCSSSCMSIAQTDTRQTHASHS